MDICDKHCRKKYTRAAAQIQQKKNVCTTKFYLLNIFSRFAIFLNLHVTLAAKSIEHNSFLYLQQNFSIRFLMR